MLTLQTDVYSELDQEIAQRLAYGIDHASRTDARLRQAADLLRTWDGAVNVDSSRRRLSRSAKAVFFPMLLKPRLGEDWRLYHWAESLFAGEQILMNEPAAWLPPQYASWDDFLADLVRQGLAQGGAPSDLRQWRYGYAHPVDVEHPLFGLLPWFKGWTGTGVHRSRVTTSTVKQVGRTFGPSQRFTIDWSNVMRRPRTSRWANPAIRSARTIATSGRTGRAADLCAALQRSGGCGARTRTRLRWKP